MNNCLRLLFEKLQTESEYLDVKENKVSICDRIYKEDYPKVTTEAGAAEISKKCKLLKNIRVITDKNIEYNVEYTAEQQAYQDKLNEETGAVVTLHPKTFKELKNYQFNSAKKYTVYLNQNCMNQGVSDPGKTYNNLQFFLKNHPMIFRVIIDKDVASIGRCCFYECGTLQSIECISEKVTEIDDMAFAFCRKVQSFSLKSPVNTLGKGLFKGCENLDKVEALPFPNAKVPANCFEDCINLKYVSLPSDLNKIEVGAFKGCTSITEFNFSSKIEFIGPSAFEGCTGLTKIKIDNAPITIESKAFLDCSSLTEIENSQSIKSISSEAFKNCKSLKEANLTSLTTLEFSAFESCDSLSSVNFSDNLILLGHDAFNACKSLKEITIPNTISILQGSLLRDCISLEKVVFGDKVTKIKDYCFQRCPNLKEISSLKNIEEIGNYVFASCELLTTSDIGEKLKILGNGAFMGCNISTISLPSVKKVSDSAFLFCKSLSNVKLNNNITDIEKAAFKGCTALKEIKLPANLKKIQKTAFYNCGLSTVDLTGVEELGEMSFGKNLNFTTFTFPASLRLLGVNPSTRSNNILEGCTGLTSVSYEDTEEKWYSVNAASGGGIIELGTTLPIKCKDGEANGDVVLEPKTFNEFQNYLFNNEVNYHIRLNQEVSNNLGVNNVFIKNNCIKSVEFLSEVTSMAENIFKNCSSISSISLSENLTAIPSYAFYSIQGISSLSIPASVTSIGESAFYSTSLDISFSENSKLTEIKKSAFSHYSFKRDSEKFILPTGLSILGESVFEESNIRFLDLSTTKVTSIPVSCFSNCSQLTSVSLPINITEILDNAFLNTRITDIVFSSALTTIGNSAFKNTLISKVELPEATINIGASAFENCSNIISVDIKGQLLNGKLSDNIFKGCQNLSSANFNSVSEIGNNAFYGCTSLSTFDFSNISKIGESAFMNTSIKEASLLNMTLILANAFNSCKLNSLIFDNTNRLDIGQAAFANNLNLSNIAIKNLDNIHFNDRAFINCGEGTVDCKNFLASIVLDNLRIFNVGLNTKTVKCRNGNIYPFDDFKSGDYFNIKNVSIPNANTLIYFTNKGTFYSDDIGRENLIKNQNVSQIVLNEGLTGIGGTDVNNLSGSETFANGKFFNIVISSTVKSIGPYTFSNCNNLKSLIFLSASKFGDSCFSNSSALNNIAFYAEDLSLSGNSIFPAHTFDCITFPDNYRLDVSNTSPFTTKKIIFVNIKKGNTLLDILYTSGQYYWSDASLETVIIPKNITKIADQAFSNCYMLKNVLKADNLNESAFSQFTSIGNLAFYRTKVFGKIEFNKEVSTIGDQAFSSTEVSEVILNKATPTPEGADDIFKGSAFSNCQSLKKVILSNIRELPDNLFENCVNLINIQFDNYLKIINNYAFRNCTSLVNITLPKSLTFLGYSVFNNTTVQELNIPKNCDFKVYNSTDNRCGPFNENNSIKKISFDPDYIGNAFSHSTCIFSGAKALEEVVLPLGLNDISRVDYAFANCSKLYSIKNYEAISAIAKYAFENCRIPQDILVNIINKLSVIPENAFNNCKTLQNLTINNQSLKEIRSFAFYGCSELKDIDLSKTSITTIGDQAFSTFEYHKPGYDTSKISSVTFPETLTTLKKQAFENHLISEINLPKSITTLEKGCLLPKDNAPRIINTLKTKEEWNSLSLTACITSSQTSLRFLGDSTSYPYIYFNNIDQISRATDNRLLYCFSPNTDTAISIEDLNNNNLIQKIQINSVIPSINNISFSGAKNIKSIEFLSNAGITIVKSNMFSNMESLKDIVFNTDKITTIEANAFSNHKLERLSIPNSVISIGNSAFSLESNTSSDKGSLLIDINLGKGLTNLGEKCFYNNAARTPTINYDNTIENWNTITKGANIFGINGLNIICTNGTTTYNGV